MSKKDTKPKLKKSLRMWATGWYSEPEGIFKAGLLATKRSDLQKMLKLLDAPIFFKEKCRKVIVKRI